MRIVAQNISKILGVQWVIKNFSGTFELGHHYAVRGSNGAGKSTFLQLISTFMEPTKGKVFFEKSGAPIAYEQAYRHFTIAAPYLDFIPHFTIDEMILFTERLKGLTDQKTHQELLELMELEGHKNKRLDELSSGMKQRVRLVCSLSANVPFVFLDEPTTNLDERSKQWFSDLLDQSSQDKTIIIASNDERDLQTCTKSINIEDYKSG